MLLSNYAIRFRTAVFVFVIALLVAGSRAYLGLPREGTPDITIPYVFVTARYDGTSPTEMEQLITIPLEKQLNDVENIKEMRATSAENLTFVAIEFMAGQNIDQARQRVKDKADLARPDLPDDLDEPVVDAFNFSSDIPVFIFTLSGVSDQARLKSLAEDLQDRIELLGGVRRVEITGVRQREIRVEIDLPRLIAYGVPLSQVMGRIVQENRTVSAGNIEVLGDKFQVRLPGEFTWISELRSIVLAERGGRPVYLTDVAVVSDTFKDETSISRVNGEPCVSLSIKKRSGVNTVALIGEVKRVLADTRLPPAVKTTVVMDQSEYVASMLSELENSIFSGFALVALVLLVFLGGRNAFFVALSIPLSMLLSFVVLAAQGTTLNMIVLFSLVMSTGMLVDNAIVIVENIYRHRTLGKSKLEAARVGAGEVAWPVITSTLTTVVAFAPLLYWPGVMGQFMSFLPRTLIVTLLASLFIALVVNPAIASIYVHVPPMRSNGRPHPFMAGYERCLRVVVRYRVVVLVLGLLMLILSGVTYSRFGKGVELFPAVDPRNATVRVKFPQGTSLARTDAVIREIESKVGRHADVKFTLANVGSVGGMMASAGETAQGTHLGSVYAEFKKIVERKGKSIDLVNLIREEIGQVPGAEIVVQKEEEGPPTGDPVSIEIAGDDFDTLALLAGDVTRRIITVPGLVDVRDDLEDALPELQFHVDRSRTARLGLDPDTIGSFLRMAIYGLETSKFRAADEEYDITLQLPANQRNNLALLDRICIPVPGRAPVALSSLGTITYTGGRGTITRKDRKRVVTVSGNDRNRSVDELLKDVRARLADLPLPTGCQIAYAGKNKEMDEAGAFLSNAFIIAVALIAIILVIQFNSVLLPFIIMITVLLSLIGVMAGLLFTGMRFGIIMTGIGVISLAGIVVNNGIVLIDCILQRRREGLSAIEAAVDAGKTRLRPVLLTAGTTVLGLIPMAVGWGVEIHEWPPRFVAGAESSTWWAPMAVAISYGLTLATVLTLAVVPAMYCLFDSLAARIRRLCGIEDVGEEVR